MSDKILKWCAENKPKAMQKSMKTFERWLRLTRFFRQVYQAQAVFCFFPYKSCDKNTSEEMQLRFGSLHWGSRGTWQNKYTYGIDTSEGALDQSAWKRRPDFLGSTLGRRQLRVKWLLQRMCHSPVMNNVGSEVILCVPSSLQVQELAQVIPKVCVSAFICKCINSRII